MARHGSRRVGMDASDPAMFEQGPMVPRGFAWGLPFLLLIGLLAPTVTSEEFNLRWVLATLFVVGVLGLVLAAATLPQTMKSVRVDGRGLHVKGQLALRARQIGFVEVMRGGPAATWSWPLSRPRGRERPRLPARQNLYGGLYGFGPAVAVEDLSGDGPTIWLIPSRDPHRLAACLERVRDQAGGRVS